MLGLGKKMNRRPRGQGITEYGICLVIILLACLGMQTYIKRGLQGRYKDTVDNMTGQVPGALPQYEPYYRTVSTMTHEKSMMDVTLSPGGAAGKEFPAGGTGKGATIFSYEGP